jgi:hypothetical protein
MIDIDYIRYRDEPLKEQCAGCGTEWPCPWSSVIDPVTVIFRGDESPDLRFTLCGDCREKLSKLLN